MRPEDLTPWLVDAGAAPARAVEDLLHRRDELGDNALVAALLALVREHEHVLGEQLAERHQRPCLLLETSTIDLTVLEGLSPEVLIEEQVLPVARREESLTVAVADPESAARALQDLGVQTGHHIVAVVAVPVLLRLCIEVAVVDHAAGNARLRGPQSASADVDLVLARPPAPPLEDADEVARALGEVLGAPAPPRGAALGVLRLKQVRVSPPPPAPPPTPTAPAMELAPPVADDAVLDLVEVHDDDGIVEVDAALLEPIDDDDVEAGRGAGGEPLPTASPADGGDEGEVAALEPLEGPTGSDGAVGAAVEATGGEGARGGRPFILIVEDDEAIGTLLGRSLQQDGYETQHLLSGEGVADVLRSRRPDVILLDAMLPGVHGFEICAALKHSLDWRDVPVAMVSAIYRSFEQVKEIHEHHGADVFIEKPFQLEHVRRVVADLLRRPAPVEAPHALMALSAARAQALIDHHLTLGDLEAATGILDRWISAEPLSARAWLERGNLAVAAGDDFRALQAFELAALYDRRLFVAQMALARHCHRLGFVRKARGAWQVAAACAPDADTAERIRQAFLSQ